MLLRVNNIEIRYGSVPAVRDLSFEIREGEIVCFVGPNGAGKSTTTLAVAGVLRPVSGDIVFNGASILGRDPESVVRSGVALVPEGRRIFARLTVRENLVVASGLRGGLSAVADIEERVLTLFPILRQRYDSYAGHLSGGEQQQLAIARGLLSKPRLLIVDEPSLGLAPKFVELVQATLKQVRDEGASLLIVEQSMKRALSIGDRLYVMRSGRVVTQGTPAELTDKHDLHQIYFGAKEATGEPHPADR